MADYFKRAIDKFSLKTCFILALPYRPANGSNTPRVIFLTKGEPSFTPAPTLLQIHWKVRHPKTLHKLTKLPLQLDVGKTNGKYIHHNHRKYK